MRGAWNGGERVNRQNCWEVKCCGRQPGGAKVVELGVCPAASETRVDGINNGINGGRSCWAVTGTYCGGKVQGSFASKLTNCKDCVFFQSVMKEEGKAYAKISQILEILKK